MENIVKKKKCFIVLDTESSSMCVCPCIFHSQGMVMVSPEMDPTICWMFEAEIVLLFHAKTFHKGFQVTVHIGNVRQTATVEAVYGKVSSSMSYNCSHLKIVLYFQNPGFVILQCLFSSYSYDTSLYHRRS